MYNNKYFDSAILFNNKGEEILLHRKISSKWTKNLSKKYSCGLTIKSTQSVLGKTAIIICDDLFDDKVKLPTDLDFLIFPFAWSMDEPYLVEKGKRYLIQLSPYLRENKKSNATFLMINSLSDKLHGGAFVLKNGELVDDIEIDKEGILYHTLYNS